MNSIERLRQSKLEADTEDFADGKEAGRNWAEEVADYRELKRLKAARDLAGDQWNVLFADAADQTGYNVTERLAFEIIPKADRDSKSAREFWETAIGDDYDGPEESEWARGFASGALEAWAELEPKLRSQPVA